MELIIYSPTENQFVKEISFNFEDIKQEMIARLAKYDGLVYTEETIKEAKVDRATLNKFKEAIEAKRKEVKKQCLAPYEEFEKKIKDLTALIDAPVLAIDTQVKNFEQRQKDEKKAEIKAYYAEHIGDLAQLLPLEKIYSEKWLNTTAKMKDITAAIDTAIERTTADLQTIADLHSEFELQIKDTYLRTLDLSAALNEKTRLEQQKARLEEYQKQKAAAEAEAQALAEQQEDIPQVAQPIHQHEEAPKQPHLIKMDFRVWATEDQLQDLKTFLYDNKIKFGRPE